MGFFSSLFGSSDADDLADVYRDADRAGDNNTMYEIENIMYEEHGRVYDQAANSWEPQDHEEPSSGGFWSRLFG